MTSLSIVGIALAMSQTEVVVIDGGITDYLVDFWHTVEFSRFKRAPSAGRFRLPRRGNSLTLPGQLALVKSRRLSHHPSFSAAYPSALSASGTDHVGRDVCPVRATNLAVFRSVDPCSEKNISTTSAQIKPRVGVSG